MPKDPEVDFGKVIEQMNKGAVARPTILIPPEMLDKIRNELIKQRPNIPNGISLKVKFEEGANLVFAHTTDSGWEVDGFVGTKWSGKFEASTGFEVLKRW